MRQTQKIFKWVTLAFFGIALFAMTAGQAIPVEFAEWHHMHLFYDVVLQGLPIAVLLSLSWTIKKERPKKANLTVGILTPLLAIATFFGTFFLMFSYGFGAWVNEQVVYENKDNSQTTINQQIWDMGALGYGGRRTVKLTPFLGLWNIVKEIDTAENEAGNWTLVEKKGDIKSP